MCWPVKEELRARGKWILVISNVELHSLGVGPKRLVDTRGIPVTRVFSLLDGLGTLTRIGAGRLAQTMWY